MQEQYRHLRIKLAVALDTGVAEQLNAALLALEGVEQLSIADATLDIEYAFPRTCIAEVTAGLAGFSREAGLKLPVGWRLRLRAFMEENERAHIQGAGDWYSYSRDIYLHYHALEEARQPNPHQQLWRRHQQTRRTGRRPT